MLNEIVNGRARSNFVLIQDDECVSGNELILTILVELCNRVEEVHFFCFCHFPDDVRKEVLTVAHNVVFHDYFSNQFGWEFSKQFDLKNIFQSINTKSNIAIVFDNLVGLIKSVNITRACTLLSQCASPRNDFNCDQLVALMHTDMHSEYEIRNLTYIADTVLRLQNHESSDGMKQVTVCETFHVGATGKVDKVSESFQCLNNKLIKTSLWNEVVPEEHDSTDDEVDNPASNLTFNLTLNEDEEEARSKLVLPYTKHLEVRMDDKVSAGDGFIYYEPDDADDFDEEDPDDDLEF